MAETKKRDEYLPVRDRESEQRRIGSHEYRIEGSLVAYPLSVYKKDAFQYGLHFSKHIHGIFVYPRAALKRLVQEYLYPKEALLPIIVVIIAGLLTGFGSLWSILLTSSVIFSFFSAITSILLIPLMPIWFIFLWVFWSLTLHVIASVSAGSDVLNKHALLKTFKFVGFCFTPAFLNILPLFSLLTPYWIWILCAWGLEFNYNLSKRAAFLATIPLLAAAVLGTFIRLSWIG